MSRLFVFTLVPDRVAQSRQVAIPQESIVKIESGWDTGTMIVNGFTVFGDFEAFTKIYWRDRVVIDHRPTVV